MCYVFRAVISTLTSQRVTHYNHTVTVVRIYILKVKVALEQATEAQRGRRRIVLLIFNLGSRRGWWTPRPGRFTPGKETRYPLSMRLGGPQGRSGRAQKISSLSGFDSYKGWAIPGPHVNFETTAYCVENITYNQRFSLMFTLILTTNKW